MASDAQKYASRAMSELRSCLTEIHRLREPWPECTDQQNAEAKQESDEALAWLHDNLADILKEIV